MVPDRKQEKERWWGAEWNGCLCGWRGLWGRLFVLPVVPEAHLEPFEAPEVNGDRAGNRVSSSPRGLRESGIRRGCVPGRRDRGSKGKLGDSCSMCLAPSPALLAPTVQRGTLTQQHGVHRHRGLRALRGASHWVGTRFGSTLFLHFQLLSAGGGCAAPAAAGRTEPGPRGGVSGRQEHQACLWCTKAEGETTA